VPDNVKVLAGTGDDTVAPPIATDLVGGQHYQRIKAGWGPDNAWNETDNVPGKRLPVVEPTLVPAIAIDAGQKANTDEVIAAPGAGTRLLGFSARETTASAGALFNLRRGVSNSDPILVTVSLGVGESTRDWYGPDGMAAVEGIWLERVTGTIQVTGYYKVVV
jgi:hypothetical protein